VCDTLSIGGGPCNDSGSLVKFAAMRRASSRVSRFGRRAMRRSDISRVGKEGRRKFEKFLREVAEDEDKGAIDV
jgi:hypothetical protein